MYLTNEKGINRQSEMGTVASKSNQILANQIYQNKYRILNNLSF